MERGWSVKWMVLVESLALIGALALGAVAVGQAAGDFESARRIDLPFTGEFDISSDEDVDYFAFQLPASRYGMEITIDIDAASLGSELDAYMSIYNEERYEIGYNDDADGSDPALSGPLAAGLHYIEVRGYSGSTGSYTLKVDASPIEAKSIGLPYAGTFDMSAEAKRDIFAFEAADSPYGLTIVIDIDAESTGSDLDLVVSLYDDGWQGIAYNDDTDGADPYLRARVTHGTYYIVVEEYYDSSGPYTLNVDTNSIEPHRIDLPYSGQSEIALADESELYLVELLDAATIVIDIDAEGTGSDLDSHLYLYDENWTEVESNDDTDGSDSYIEMAMEAGIYFIEVKGYSDSTGDYTLTVETVKD
jgi:hypothetical protein